jgi:hypothetical protein
MCVLRCLFVSFFAFCEFPVSVRETVLLFVGEVVFPQARGLLIDDGHFECLEISEGHVQSNFNLLQRCFRYI